MRGVHLEETDAGQHPLHVGLERLPPAGVVAAPAERLEVVDDDEAALCDVLAKRRGLAVRQRPPAGLDEVGDGYRKRSGSSSARTLKCSVCGPR